MEARLCHAAKIQSPLPRMAKRDSVVEARSTSEKSTRRRRLSVVAVVVDGDDVSTKATRDVAATNVHELFGPKKTPSFPDTGFRVVLRQMWFENIHPRNINLTRAITVVTMGSFPAVVTLLEGSP